MPVLRAPRYGTLASGVDAFTDALVKSALLKQSMARDERQAELDALKLTELKRLEERERLFPQDVQALMAGGPAAAGASTLASPEALALRAGTPEPQTAPSPAAAAPTGMTMGQLGQQVGADTLARIIQHPRGPELLKARGVVTDEEFQRRQRTAKARQDSRKAFEEAAAAYQAGDALTGVSKEAAAYRALAEALNEPTPALVRASEHAREYLKLFKEKEERGRADVDAKAITKAIADYNKAVRASGRPTPAAATPDARTGELGVLERPDGRRSTELSITVTDARLNGGRPTNVQLLVKGQVGVADLLAGQRWTPDQQEIAVRRAAERVAAGAALPSYDSVPEAETAARARSDTGGSTAVSEPPDVTTAFTNLATALTGATSEAWKKKSMAFADKVIQDIGEEMKAGRMNAKVGAIHQRVVEVLGQQRDQGQTPDLEKAYKIALSENPDAAAEFLNAMFTSGKTIPGPIAKALFGETDVPKTSADQAHKIVTVNERIAAGTPAYYTRLRAVTTEIEKERHTRTPLDRSDRAALLQLRGQLSREINTLEKQLGEAVRLEERQRMQREVDAKRQELEDVRDALSDTGLPRKKDRDKPTATPGQGAAALTPAQKQQIATTMTAVLQQFFPGRDPRTLKPEEKKRVEDEVHRRLSGTK